MLRATAYVALLALPICALAADPKPPAAKPAPKQPQVESETVVSIDFLEYLGSLESDEDNWTDFEAVIAAPAKQPSKKAEGPTKPAAAETTK